jgi:hypothetical protein
MGTERMRWSGFGNTGSLPEQLPRKRDPNPAASTTAHLTGSGVISLLLGQQVPNPSVGYHARAKEPNIFFYQ